MSRIKVYDDDEVLQQAMELFWKQGFHATSMQDLVNHLGLNRSSIYDGFGNKRKLFDQAFKRYCDTNRKQTSELLNNQTDTIEGIKTLFELNISCAINDCDNKGCFVVNTTTELIPTDDEIAKVLSKNKASYEKMFYNFLLAGQKKGDVSQDIDLKSVAGLIYTLLCGINVFAKIDRNRKKLLAQVDTVITILN